MRLNAHTEEGNRQLLRFIEAAPEILECYSQTGDADFLMKIVVRDLDQLSAFVDRMIRSTGGLASIRSAIVLKTIKKTTELPLQLVRLTVAAGADRGQPRSATRLQVTAAAEVNDLGYR